MDDKEAIETLANILQEEGYRAKISHGGITTGIGGMSVGLFYYDNDTIQLSCGVTLEELDFGVESANAFNRRYRYAKIYIDEEGDAVLSADYLIDLTRPSAAEEVINAVNNFDGCIRLFRNSLTSADKESRGDSAARASQAE